MGFWKDRFVKGLKSQGGAAAPPYQIGKFQAGGFHHRLRDGERYSGKWQYVRENPVRAGWWSVQRIGRISSVHEIRWSGD